MKKVYNQPYTKNRSITCWYGKPPKGVFKHDVIKIKLPAHDQVDGCKCEDIIYVTPDEAADLIRALSAGIHHFLVKDESVQHIIRAKK